MFFTKKKKYDLEAPRKELQVEKGSLIHLKEKTDDDKHIWVEKTAFKMHSTTGMGGSYMHLYKQKRRWDRDQQWYVSKREGFI